MSFNACKGDKYQEVRGRPDRIKVALACVGRSLKVRYNMMLHVEIKKKVLGVLQGEKKMKS